MGLRIACAVRAAGAVSGRVGWEPEDVVGVAPGFCGGKCNAVILELVTSSLKFTFLLVQAVCLLLEFAKCCAFSRWGCESS